MTGSLDPVLNLLLLRPFNYFMLLICHPMVLFFIKGRLLKNNTKYKKSQNNQKERKIYIRDKIGQIMNNFFLFFNSVLLFPFPFSLFSFQFHFSFRFSFLDIFFTIIRVAFKLVNGSC
jgi:hypothetical protein